MDNKNAYALREDEKAGSVYLQEDVVACIASLAATRDIDGVLGIYDGGQEGKGKSKDKGASGSGKAPKGVSVNVHHGIVDVDLNISILYGYNIPAICQKVQAKVKNMIENMTGMKVGNVNLRIAGLNMGKGKA
ncbi:MAG: Asp23/Gls24 family envelope stress response protein [Lachnospiraceae bacterium]|nr:Asp23/Gls24 family envelope stress response protein [Lachnospiraceae bacterium]